MVIYQSGERRLSLFQMPGQGLALGPMRQMTVQGRNYRCGHHKGVEVVTWQDRGILFALASDLPEKDLLQLARF
jgi:anti-sigma factor RsiW